MYNLESNQRVFQNAMFNVATYKMNNLISAFFLLIYDLQVKL